MDINGILNSINGDLLIKRLQSHQIVETRESFEKLVRHNVKKRIASAKKALQEKIKGNK